MTRLLVILFCSLPSLLLAQTFEADLRLTNVTTSPGLPLTTRVLLDHDVDCEAFSFGVTHDESLLTLSSVERGIHLPSQFDFQQKQKCRQ